MRACKTNGYNTEKDNLVIRTVYLPLKLDLILRDKAKKENKSIGELIRELLIKKMKEEIDSE